MTDPDRRKKLFESIAQKGSLKQQVFQTTLEIFQEFKAVLYEITEQYGEVCPAGWNKGEEGMKPTAEGVAEYLSKHSGDL